MSKKVSYHYHHYRYHRNNPAENLSMSTASGVDRLDMVWKISANLSVQFPPLNGDKLSRGLRTSSSSL